MECFSPVTLMIRRLLDHWNESLREEQTIHREKDCSGEKGQFSLRPDFVVIFIPAIPHRQLNETELRSTAPWKQQPKPLCQSCVAPTKHLDVNRKRHGWRRKLSQSFRFPVKQKVPVTTGSLPAIPTETDEWSDTKEILTGRHISVLNPITLRGFQLKSLLMATGRC